MALSAVGLPPVAASALVAGLSTLEAGGGLGDALLSAAFAAAAAGLSRWIGGRGLGRLQAHAAQGIAQGGVSRLAGGSFRAGFWGGSVGHWAGGRALLHFSGNGTMSMAGRTAAAAMAGGAAAELGGGKSGNGAVSAAFAHLFSNESKLAEIRRDIRGRYEKDEHGNSPLDETRRFKTADEAATEALKEIQGVAREHDVELGGYIRRIQGTEADGYAYPGPDGITIGTARSVGINLPSPNKLLPANAPLPADGLPPEQLAALFHTHPDYHPGSLFFSSADRAVANKYGVPSYIIGTGGEVRLCRLANVCGSKGPAGELVSK